MLLNERFNFGLPNQILFDNDPSSGSSTVELPEEVLKGFKALLSREGSEKDAALKLYEENYEHRKEIRRLKEDAEKIISLSDEDKALFDGLKAIYAESGFEKVDDFKSYIEEAKTNKETLATLKKEKSLSEVAEVIGWNPKVLNQIGGEKEYEIKTKEVDGKEVKYAVIKDGDAEKSLSDFAKAEWSHMLPALELKPETNRDDNGTTYTPQTPSNPGSSSKDPVSNRLERNKKERGLEVEKN